MNKIVSKYIKQQRENEMINRGLFNKRYCTYEETKMNGISVSPSRFSRDEQGYYEIIPFEITDQEWEEILKYKHIDGIRRPSGIVKYYNFMGWLSLITGIMISIALSEGIFVAILIINFVGLAVASLFFGLAHLMKTISYR